MTGKDKFQEAGKQLKNQIAKEEVKEKELVVASDQSLEVLKENKELAAMYEDMAGEGAENLGGSLPNLKIHYTNQSEGNELPDGTEPNNGWFYHQATKQQYESVRCHVLLISRGYQASRLNPKPGEKPTQFTQIMAGMIIEGDAPTIPFIHYVKGLSLSPMWDWGKKLSPFTKKLPLYAFTTILKTKQEKTDAGNKVWVLDFDIVRDGDFPTIVTDEGKLQFLRDSYNQMREQVDSLVSNAGSEEVSIEPPHPAEDSQTVKDAIDIFEE